MLPASESVQRAQSHCLTCRNSLHGHTRLSKMKLTFRDGSDDAFRLVSRLVQKTARTVRRTSEALVETVDQVPALLLQNIGDIVDDC
jgi:hypothetical protein